MAIDPRAVTDFPSTGGSRNRRHGSLLWPLMCETQEAGVHLQPHGPPRAA